MNFEDGNLLGDFILVRKLEKKRVTEGGIFLPESQVKDNMFGEVLKVGPGIMTQNGLHPTTLKPGHVVLINPASYTLRFPGTEDVYILREADVLWYSDAKTV